MKVDAQLDMLLRPLGRTAEELAKLLAQLPFVQSAERMQLLKRIERLLLYAEDEVRQWAEQQLEVAAESHDEKLFLALPASASIAAVAQLTSQVSAQLRSAVRQASRNVMVLAHRLSSPTTVTSTVSDFLRTRRLPSFRQEDAAKQQLFERQVRDAISSGFVTVTGRNGRAYRYALDYWVGLQAFMSRQLLLRQISIYRVQEAGYDLVQVSSNPSTIGDFCDLYRGRVFSLSGTHAFYPPLSSTPNGGPPFHPWCRHVLWPYTEEGNDPGLADIPEEFLQLGAEGTSSTNDFQRLWLEFSGGAVGDES